MKMETATEIKTYPMLFAPEMVRAIVAGTKTQTRRVVKPQPPADATEVFAWYAPHLPDEVKAPEGLWYYVKAGLRHHIKCPQGKPGDRLWVRETCQAVEVFNGLDGVHYPADDGLLNQHELGATDEQFLKLYNYAGGKGQRVPSIHMPRWASRITLEITDVKVERVQAISEADAIAEGFTRCTYRDGRGFETAKSGFMQTWQAINGRESWDANPWVWCVSFKKAEAPK